MISAFGVEHGPSVSKGLGDIMGGMADTWKKMPLAAKLGTAAVPAVLAAGVTKKKLTPVQNNTQQAS